MSSSFLNRVHETGDEVFVQCEEVEDYADVPGGDDRKDVVQKTHRSLVGIKYLLFDSKGIFH